METSREELDIFDENADEFFRDNEWDRMREAFTKVTFFLSQFINSFEQSSSKKIQQWKERKFAPRRRKTDLFRMVYGRE